MQNGIIGKKVKTKSEWKEDNKDTKQKEKEKDKRLFNRRRYKSDKI